MVDQSQRGCESAAKTGGDICQGSKFALWSIAVQLRVLSVILSVMMRNIISVVFFLIVALLGCLVRAEGKSTSQDSLLPLAEAITQAHAASPLRRAAQARADAAISARQQAGLLPNPVLDIREENLPFRGGSRGPLDHSVDVFAVLSQSIETGGKRSARRAIAEAEVEEASATSHQVEQQLTLDVVRLYLAALRAYRLTEIMASSRTELQTLLDMMQQRVAEGYTAEADLMRFNVEAARLDLEIARTQLDFARDVAALGAILAVPEPIAGTRLVEPTAIAAPQGDVKEIAQQVVARRPEILAAQARVERARHALELEIARRLPDVSLVAGYKRSGGNDTVVTGFMVPLPLFDRNFGNIERAAAEERAAVLDLGSLTAQLKAETIVLINTAQELNKYAHLADQQILTPAGVVRDAARTAFREGSANILQLVDAERVYTDARREVLVLKLEAYEKAFAARLLVSGKSIP